MDKIPTGTTSADEIAEFFAAQRAKQSLEQSKEPLATLLRIAGDVHSLAIAVGQLASEEREARMADRLSDVKRIAERVSSLLLPLWLIAVLLAVLVFR